ncbi:nucleotidyltransferase family protein [Paenibacillus tarimensis]
MIRLNPFLNEIFRKAADLNIEHYYIGAGYITQSVWNQLLGFPLHHGIKDIDFVYFDPDISYDKECEVIHTISKQFTGNTFFNLDIKNQARVHLWYEKHFGYPIEPYASLEEAINTWPTTATAIGLRLTIDGRWRVYAPFGLNDLYGLIVRANKVQITKEIFERKVQRWKHNWPELKVIPWD